MNEALAKVLATEEGRQALWEIMADCGTFVNAFTGNSQTFFLLGKQFIGQKILLAINEIDFRIFSKMQEEADLRSKAECGILNSELKDKDKYKGKEGLGIRD